MSILTDLEDLEVNLVRDRDETRTPGQVRAAQAFARSQLKAMQKINKRRGWTNDPRYRDRADIGLRKF